MLRSPRIDEVSNCFYFLSPYYNSFIARYDCFPSLHLIEVPSCNNTVLFSLKSPSSRADEVKLNSWKRILLPILDNQEDVAIS